MKMKNKKILTAMLTVLVLIALSMVPFMLTGCSGDGPANAQVVTGFGHSVVLRDDGTVWAWGRNEEGQLGNGNRVNQATPVRFRIEPFTFQGRTFTPPEYVTQIASHKIHTMALGNDGTVWAGGWNQEGQLGAPVGCRTTPIAVPFPEGTAPIVDIDAGMLFSIALCADGNVFGWGRNRNQIMMNAVTATTPAQRINTLARATRFESPHLYNITQIAAGHEHVLALRGDGTVIGWGRNRNGQVANVRNPVGGQPSPIYGPPGGLTWDILVPRVITGYDAETGSRFPTDPRDRVVQVIGGGFHSLALTQMGHVYAWGRSDRGQIGDGESHLNPNGTVRSAQPVPQRVSIPEGFYAVYVAGTSADSNAAILNDGRVITWGRNQEGQLGIGMPAGDREFAFEATPVFALRTVGMQLENIISIGVGETHMSAICGVHGDVFSWGTNWDGQLGNAGITQSVTPLQVRSGLRGAAIGGSPPHVYDTAPLTGITELSGGHLFTLALGEDGVVRGWGRNNHGQLLMQHSIDHPVATRLEDFRVLDHRFGGIQGAWVNNMRGNLSPLEFREQIGQPNFHALGGVTSIAASMEIGFAFGLAVRDGHAYGWGDNEDGWLGHGYVVNRRRTLGEEPKDNNPRPMLTGTGGTRVSATAVSAGARHSLILRPTTGHVYAAGNRGHGRLGVADLTTHQNYPIRVSFPLTAPAMTQIYAGMWSSFSIDANGYLWGWGRNHTGQLGDNTTTDRETPVRIMGPTQRLTAGERVVEVSSRRYHTIALTSNGRVFTWGQGWNGRLGHGNGDQMLVPTQVMATSINDPSNRVISVSAGDAHTLVLRENGSIMSWGQNNRGQLGRPASGQQQNIPGQVIQITNATSISAGSETSVAITGYGTNQRVYSWGTNNAGALGSGGYQIRPPREAVQQGIATDDDVVIIANSSTSAVQARGVGGAAFFNVQRSDGLVAGDDDGLSGAMIFLIVFWVLFFVIGGGFLVLWFLVTKRGLVIRVPLVNKTIQANNNNNNRNQNNRQQTRPAERKPTQSSPARKAPPNYERKPVNKPTDRKDPPKR